MDAYPVELRSPPVPLVALIGLPALQTAIGNYLRTQGVNALGLPDAHSAAGTFGEGAAAAPAGWLAPLACCRR